MRTCVRVRRAPRPLRLLVPRRGLAAGGAGGGGGGAGYKALALTDHDGLSRLDGVRAGRRGRSGCGRSTGRRWRSRTAATSRCWSRTRAAGATSAGSSRARTRTPRPQDAPPPRPSPLGRRSRQHAAGLVCLSGCARQGVHDEPTMRAAAATPSGATACGSSCSGPSTATTARATARLRRAGRAARACRAWPRATSTRTRARARRCRTRSSRSASTRRSTPPSRCGAATTPTCSPRPAAMAARFADHPGAVAETRGARRAADASTSRQDLGYRYPGAEDAEAQPHARRAVRAALRGALPARQPAPRRGARRAWRRSCA